MSYIYIYYIVGLCIYNGDILMMRGLYIMAYSGSRKKFGIESLPQRRPCRRPSAQSSYSWWRWYPDGWAAGGIVSVLALMMGCCGGKVCNVYSYMIYIYIYNVFKKEKSICIWAPVKIPYISVVAIIIGYRFLQGPILLSSVLCQYRFTVFRAHLWPKCFCNTTAVFNLFDRN